MNHTMNRRAFLRTSTTAMAASVLPAAAAVASENPAAGNPAPSAGVGQASQPSTIAEIIEAHRVALAEFDRVGDLLEAHRDDVSADLRRADEQSVATEDAAWQAVLSHPVSSLEDGRLKMDYLSARRFIDRLDGMSSEGEVKSLILSFNRAAA
ncbi:MAG TPA: hypothetical protein ENH55_12210 [Aurantimonas coralicida]|uniref:Twin-arginine translocation signal domain-containing protein n=2 Tax=root TaxID=1 RepID=A0A9C9NJE0_9HYPH|nr:hypothetical protein [Aurantimonas coralicida]HEU02603.1 hypothetical protein [Aurantimonas coralicida]